jgi:thiosulfate/3-mercaptopyruvate sulfurtransferase
MEPLISVEELRALMGTPAELRIVDCRFNLAAPAQAERDYQTAHIEGAVYAHLERDLSGPVVPGVTGRHPLPDVQSLSERLGSLGISEHHLVVVYDEGSGAFAARLWWLLDYLGHERVRVLDGGLAAYIAAGGVLNADPPAAHPTTFRPRLRPGKVADLYEVAERSAGPDPLLFDARARERFRGENETIDRVAGHIPGAHSLPFMENLEQGRFLSPKLLRARLLAAAGSAERLEESIVYCGSGVTACHLILAARVAGLPEPRLYAGSYSEWIADGSRSVSVGDPWSSGGALS